MYHLTTVVFAIILCVGPLGPTVMVMLMLVVMVFGLMVTRPFPLTTFGASIRASTEADLGEMPTVAHLYHSATLAGHLSLTILWFLSVSITLSFHLQFANLC